MATQDPLQPGRLPGDTGAKPQQAGRLPSDLSIDQKEGLAGKQQSFRYDEFDFQPRLDQDNYKLRAQDQGFLESTGLRFANLVPNIAGGIVEGLGYLGTLGEVGTERDYKNWMTEAGGSMKNLFGEVYRENPNEVWDPSDAAWWGDAFFGLVESASSFAVQGAGLAKVFSQLGKVARLMGAGANGIKLANGVGQVATSGLLAYTEGAMSGAAVFDRAFKAQYDKGLLNGLSSDEAHARAKQIASNAAATTVQLNTVVNTALNMTAIAPLFKQEDEVMNWFRTQGKRQQGESFGAWGKRVKNAATTDPAIAQYLKSHGPLGFAAEAGQEGMEEMTNQFAERRGEDIGSGQQKQTQGLADLLDNMGKYFEDTLDSEGAFNFVLGAFGGAGQTGIVDNMPFHKVKVGADGTPIQYGYDDDKTKTRWVSSNTLGKMGEKKYFNNVKDALVSDINRISELNTKIGEAVSAGKHTEANQLKAQLFDAAAINSIGLGLGANFKAQYQEIANLDNSRDLGEALKPQLDLMDKAIAEETDTLQKEQLQKDRAKLADQVQQLTGVTEAMQRGFAKDKNDNKYKDTAAKVEKRIDEYQKLYNTIQRQFSSGDEWDTRYGDYLFQKEVDIRSRRHVLADANEELKEMEAERDKTYKTNEDPVTTRATRDIISDVTTKTKLESDSKAISASLKTLSNAKATDAEKTAARQILMDLGSKYGITGDSEEDAIAGAHSVLQSINEKNEELNNKIYESITQLEAAPVYQDWKAKNPKGNPGDFAKLWHEDDQAISALRWQIDELSTQTDTAEKEVKKLRSTSGRNKYISQAKATKNRLAKAEAERARKQRKASTEKFYNDKAVKDLDTLQRKQYAEVLKQKREELVAKLNERKQYQKEIQDDLARRRTTFLGRLNSNYIMLVKESRKVSDRISSLQNAIEQIDAKLEELKTAPTAGAVTGQPKKAPPQPVTPSVQQSAQQGVQQPPVNPPTPPTPKSDKILSGGSDAAMEKFLGSQAALDSLIAAIYNLQSTGTLPDMLAMGRQVLEDQLDGMLHEWLTDVLKVSKQDKAAHDLNVDAFLARHLKAAGKIGTAKTPENDLVAAIGSLNKTDAEKANLLVVLDQLEKGTANGSFKYSTDGVVRVLKASGVSENDAPAIAQAFEKVHQASIEANAKYQAAQQQAPPAPKAAVVTTASQPKVVQPAQVQSVPSPASNSGQALAFNPQLQEIEDQWRGMYHDGMKTETAIKGAVLTHEYFDTITTVENAIASTGPAVINPESRAYDKKDRFSLNPHLNPLWLQPGYIVAGTTLQLVVDTDFDGFINDDNTYSYGGPKQRKDSFGNYVDADGNVKLDEEFLGNVPIKVVDPRTGQTVSYLHRTDWVTAKYEGTDSADFRNVVDEKYNYKGELIYENNVEEQKQALLALRRHIVRAYNMGMTEGLPTKVTQRSSGIPMRTNDLRKASDLLPDASIQIGLVSGGRTRTGPYSSAEDSAQVVLPRGLEGQGINNVPGVLLPDSSGRLVFEPLITNRLSAAEIDTAIRAMEVYMTLLDPDTTDEAKARAEGDAAEIEATTGFNVRSSTGLEGFIDQYYYFSTNFSDTQVNNNPRAEGDNSPRTQQFLLSIGRNIAMGDSHVTIKAGATNSGRLAYAGVDENGVMSENFRTLLHDRGIGMASRFRNIKLANQNLGVRGVNDRGPISEAVYHPETQQWSRRDYHDYNNLVLENSKTNLYGKLRDRNNRYVYFAHPVTEFDANFTKEQPLFDRKARRAAQAAAEVQRKIIEDRLTQEEKDAADDLLLFSPVLTVVSAVGNVEGKDMNLANLQAMRNFTPINNRNDRTPESVFEELRLAGIATLPKGYNPFYTC